MKHPHYTHHTLLAYGAKSHHRERDRHIDVSKMVVNKALYQGYDEEFDSYNIDEDKVCDELEEMMNEGGVICE